MADGTNKFVIRGQTGELRWGYRLAATLGAWTIDSGHLTASVSSSNAFRVTQTPLTFDVVRPSGKRWSWKVADVTVADNRCWARIDEGESE